jgi:hypothetical protein
MCIENWVQLKGDTATANSMLCFLCDLRTHVTETKYSPNVDKNVVLNLLEYLASWWRQHTQYENQGVLMH